MEEVSSIFRQEEIPALGGYVLQNALRDRKDFEEFSPRYGEDFFVVYQKDLEQVKMLINPERHRKEMKEITDRIQKKANSLRPYLNKLQLYVKRCNGNLTINTEEYGIKKLRIQISRKDGDAIVERIKVVTNNIRIDGKVLASMGLKSDIVDYIARMEREIGADDQLQYEKLKAYQEAVDGNREKILKLWSKISELVETGKALYKYSDPRKYNDYKLTYLRSLIRNDKKKKE